MDSEERTLSGTPKLSLGQATQMISNVQKFHCLQIVKVRFHGCISADRGQLSR